MKRLISPAFDGGVPYMNMDFSDVLQRQHIKAYASLLDSLNDVPMFSGEMDRGIILSGLEVLDKDEYTTTLSMTNSVIYIPGMTGSGDFYEPSPSLVGSDQIALTPIFYLGVEKEDEFRFLKSGNEEVVIEKKYFNIFSEPPSEPHIKFRFGKTSRRYSRILRYKLATPGQISITGNLDDFDLGTGLGEGEMFGFCLCNGKEDYNEEPLYDMRGRYAMGFEDNPSGNSNDISDLAYRFDSVELGGITSYADDTNYGVIGNKGGGVIQKISDTVSNFRPSGVTHQDEMVRHTHGALSPLPNATGRTSLAGRGVQHFHAMESGDEYNVSNNNAGPSRFGRGSQDGTSEPQKRFFEGGGFGGLLGTRENSNLNNHKHSIPVDGGLNFAAVTHEGRPPYLVLAYYQKIDLNFE
jgi:hypothetical protein